MMCVLMGFVDLVFAEVSSFMHACEGDAVTKLTNEKVPFFNAPIYLKNMTQIGKVDEIFGPINEAVGFSHFLFVCFNMLVASVIFFGLLWNWVLMLSGASLVNMQYFSIKMMEGIVATSYSSGDKFYIDPRKLLPLARFLPQPKYGLFASHCYKLTCL